MALTRVKTWITCFIAVLAALFAGAAAPGQDEEERVGSRGDSALISFEGLETYSVDEIRKGLHGCFEFWLAGHCAAPLDAFVDLLPELVRTGYRNGGFPEAAVTASVNGATGLIEVEVVEGPRYLCGDVIVDGARIIPVDSLVETLTAAPAASNARSIAPAEPVWKPDWPAPFAASTRQRLRFCVKKALEDFGLFFPKLEVAVVPGEHRRAALRVTIDDEGPRGVVGAIEIAGNKRNTREEILEFLALEPGMTIDRQVREEIERKLRESGRFLQCALSFRPPHGGTGAITLHLDVVEYSKAPRLGEELSQGERALLRTRDWLSEFEDRDEDFVFTSGVDSADRLVRFVISHEKGLFCEIRTSIPGHPRPLHYAVIISPERAVVISPGRRKIQPLTDRSFVVTARFDLTASGVDSEQPFRFYFMPSITTPHGDDTGGGADRKAFFDLEMDLLPVAFVGMAHLGEINCNVEEGSLTVEGSSSSITIDLETGRLAEINAVLLEDVEHFRVASRGRFARGAFDEMAGSFLQECEGYDVDAVHGRPISSLLSFIASEIMHHLLARSDEARGVADREVRGAGVAVSRLAEYLALESLDRLIPEPQADASIKAPFFIPTSDPAAGTNLMEIVARAGLPLAHQLFPPRSWPCTLIRESLLMIRGKGLYARAELQRLYESNRMGPVGFCATAHLLTLVDARMAKAFAAKGIRLLSTEGFRKDCLALLEGESILGDILYETAQSLRTLTAEESLALGAGIGGLEGEIFAACIERLRKNRERPLSESLPSALEPLWDRVLKDRIETLLRDVLEN